MTRFLTLGTLALSVLGVLGAAARQQPAPQQPVFRGTGEAVRVFVTVTDRDGRLVTNLKREDFEIRDDGKPQPITLFDDTPQPIRLIVLLDCSGSMYGNLPLLRDATVQLVERLRPDDVARLGTFGKDVTISPEFTHDAQALVRAIPASIPDNAPTPLWRAIDDGVTAFGAERDPRAVVLVLSDGKDEPAFGFRQPFVSQGEVIDHARQESVMVYGVGMRSRPSRPQAPGIGMAGLRAAMLADLPDPGLAKVAEQTGGGYTEIRAGEDLGAAFTQVADELHSQYLLGYAPPRRDGKVHKIDVRVTGHGLQARARKSYVAPKE